MASDPSSGILGSLLHTVPVGLIAIDDNSVILDANETLLEWLKQPPEAVIGETLERLLPPGGKIFCQTHLLPLLRSSGSVSELYFALVTRTQEEIPVLLNAKRQVRGEAASSVIAFMQIDNRRQFEGALLQAWKAEQAAREEVERKSRQLDDLNNQLQQANVELTATQQRLEQSVESKDEFIGLVAHELKNPLAALAGTFSLLARTLGSRPMEENQSIVADLHVEFVRLNSVIDNLLVIARSEMAQLDDLEPMRLSRVVETVVTRHLTMPGAQSILVRTDQDTSLVLGSPPITEQILDNFLTNAKKYGRDGAPIEVAIGVANGEVDVTVFNDGELLSQEEVQRFFEPFYRASSSRVKAQGVGLGLTVCQRLAEAQGGRITARPRLAGGLAISLMLPALIEP